MKLSAKRDEGDVRIIDNVSGGQVRTYDDLRRIYVISKTTTTKIVNGLVAQKTERTGFPSSI
jgi:hypothetical protein